MPGAVQGSNIVREAWSTNDPYFWGSMGFHSNGGVWWPIGPSAILRVVAPIAPFRNDAGGQPTGDGTHCGWAGYALCWTWAGTAHFDFQRIHVDLTLARSPDTTVWQGTSATFTAGMSQTNFPGNPYPVDMSALQWRWISDSTASDSVACQSVSGKTCTRVFATPGTMYSAAYVNGEAQQKSMHVDVRIPKLELSASQTTLLAPGDSDTFVATGDLPMVIEGWNFAPDTVGGSSPDATVGSTWGACVANASTCTNYVSRPGTVSVIGTVHGVRRTARLHVDVVQPKITLTASKTTLVYGDSSTFTATANGTPLVIQGWSFAADSSPGQAVSIGSFWGACIPNEPVCTMVVPTSGTVFVVGTVGGYGSRDSLRVVVTSSSGCGASPSKSPTTSPRLDGAPSRLAVPTAANRDCMPGEDSPPPTLSVTCPDSVLRGAPVKCISKLQPNTRAFTITEKRASVGVRQLAVVDTVDESLSAGSWSTWEGDAVETSTVTITATVMFKGQLLTLTQTSSFVVKKRTWARFVFPAERPPANYVAGPPILRTAYPGIVIAPSDSVTRDSFPNGGLGKNTLGYKDYRKFVSSGPNRQLLFSSAPPTFLPESVFISIALDPGDAFYKRQGPDTATANEASPAPYPRYCVSSDLETFRTEILWHEGAVEHLNEDHHTVNRQFFVDNDVMNDLFEGLWVPFEDPTDPRSFDDRWKALVKARYDDPLDLLQKGIDDRTQIHRPNCKFRKP